MGQFEGFADVDPDVRRCGGVLEEGVEEQQFLVVLLVADVGVDGHAIIQVKGEGEDRVVHDAHVVAVTVENDVQVLDVKLLQLDAVLAVQPLLEDLVVPVDVVQDLVSVLLFARREHDDFVPLSKPF